MSYSWHLYLMATLYVIAGANHFRNPKMYVRIIPAYFSNPKLLNIITGFAEIILGIGLCIPAISQYAAMGVIALLIAIFPAHLYMLTHSEASFKLPRWFLLARLPLQLLLIYWAYQYI